MRESLNPNFSVMHILRMFFKFSAPTFSCEKLCLMSVFETNKLKFAYFSKRLFVTFVSSLLPICFFFQISAVTIHNSPIAYFKVAWTKPLPFSHYYLKSFEYFHPAILGETNKEIKHS